MIHASCQTRVTWVSFQDRLVRDHKSTPFNGYNARRQLTTNSPAHLEFLSVSTISPTPYCWRTKSCMSWDGETPGACVDKPPLPPIIAADRDRRVTSVFRRFHLVPIGAHSVHIGVSENRNRTPAWMVCSGKPQGKSSTWRNWSPLPE